MSWINADNNYESVQVVLQNFASEHDIDISKHTNYYELGKLLRSTINKSVIKNEELIRILGELCNDYTLGSVAHKWKIIL